jgi:hypothetical protein
MEPWALSGDETRPGHVTAPERLALVALGTSGAVIVPLALNRFVFGKLALATVGMLLATYVPARGRLPSAAARLLIVAGGLLVLTSLSGATPLAQVLGRPPRYEGVFVLTVYVGGIVAGARLLGANRAGGSTRWFLWGLSLAALAVGAVAALEASGVRPLATDVARPGSLLGNASDEGAWAVLVLGPLSAVAIRGRRPLHIAGAAAAVAALVCSGSRGALVGVLAVAATLAALAPAVRPRAVLLAGVVAVAIGAGALPATRARVLGRSPLAARTVVGRDLLWTESARLILGRPLLGAGPSGYVDAITTDHTAGYYQEVGTADPPDSPHSWPLQAASAGGVGLVLVALGLVGLTLRAGWRGARRQVLIGEAASTAGMLAGLCGYAVALLFHFTSPGTTPLAAVFAGALLANGSPGAPARRASSATATWGRWIARLGLGGLTLVFVAAATAELPLRRGILAAASGDVHAADRAFHRAATLRPWDAGVDATATHAFASLAALGVPGAGVVGERWNADELREYPGSIQALEDGATLAIATGDPARARGLLKRAAARDPHNPLIRDALAALAPGGSGGPGPEP